LVHPRVAHRWPPLARVAGGVPSAPRQSAASTRSKA